MKELKNKVNGHLSELAKKIQVNAGSFLVWGGTELPDELRKELERDQDEARNR